MLTHVKTPNGDLIARHLIDRVTLYPNKGVVVVMDGYGRMLAHVKLDAAAKAERVRDLFNEVVLEKRNAKQPDWSFLTTPAPAPAPTPAPVPVPVPVPVVAKSPKVAKAAKLLAASSDTTTTEA